MESVPVESEEQSSDELDESKGTIVEIDSATGVPVDDWKFPKKEEEEEEASYRSHQK